MAEQTPVDAEVPNYDDVPSVPDPGGDGGGWHSELPRVTMDALYGRQVVIHEIDPRDSTYQEGRQYLLICASLLDKAVKGVEVDSEGEETSIEVAVGQQFTTMTGSGRVVDQLLKVQAFPIKGQVERYTTKNQRVIPELQPIQ